MTYYPLNILTIVSVFGGVLMDRQQFNILSIDGGGLRGVYPAAILCKVQEELGINFYKEFDLISGTSTGAIIAAGLAIGMEPCDILDLYKSEGDYIFDRKFLGGLVTPKYDSKNLRSVLDNQFGDRTFKDAKTRLMVTATNVSDGMPWVFKSMYHRRLSRDENVRLSDAVLASCSAPLYFNPYKYNEVLLADGGLWANNPALAALVEALGHNIRVKRYKIRLISIGTGFHIKHYPIEWAEKEWGAIRWGVGLIDIIFNMQSLSVEKYLETIMKEDQYLRINFEFEKNISMDSIKSVEELIDRALIDYYKYENKLKELLGK